MGCYAAIDNQNTKKESISMKDFNFGVRNCICMQITKPRKHCFKHIRALFSLTEQGGTASQHCFGSSEPRPLQISVLPPHATRMSVLAPTTSLAGIRKAGMVPLLEKQNFSRTPRGSLFLSHWLESCCIATPHKGD